MLAGLYQYRLGNVGWAVSIYMLVGQIHVVMLGCINIYNGLYRYVRIMLDGLYRYRLGNVGWAVSI